MGFPLLKYGLYPYWDMWGQLIFIIHLSSHLLEIPRLLFSEPDHVVFPSPSPTATQPRTPIWNSSEPSNKLSSLDSTQEISRSVLEIALVEHRFIFVARILR